MSASPGERPTGIGEKTGGAPVDRRRGVSKLLSGEDMKGKVVRGGTRQGKVGS